MRILLNLPFWPRSMHFGYARVSAKNQNLDTWLLQAAGVARIF